ncbi:hypothetical protein [Ktedonospora formicarum]|nr:hypothetical protein [Ktedonospora formicarum]
MFSQELEEFLPLLGQYVHLETISRNREKVNMSKPGEKAAAELRAQALSASLKANTLEKEGDAAGAKVLRDKATQLHKQASGESE